MNHLIFDRTSSPTLFLNSKNRISSHYSSINKKKDMCWYQCRLARREWPGGTGRHACNLSAARGHWILKGQRSLRAHVQCNWIFKTLFLHNSLCTHGKQVCVKRVEGGSKDLRIHFEGKCGEDSLRLNWRCSVSNTCLLMGFSMLKSPNPCFQWVSLPRSRSSSTWDMEKGAIQL